MTASCAPRTALPALLALLLIPSAAGHAGAPAGAPTPAPTPAPAAPLFDDLGTYHHAITTRSERAQQYFDQGLRLVYGFNHDEAERSFREAARLDPGCAMAYWGVALTLGPNINLPTDPKRAAAAQEAVTKALALAPRADEPERAYIEALAKRYSADPAADRGALDHAYAFAMRDLSKRYPDDLDAATLYAESLMDLRPWKFWTPDGRPAPDTEEIVSVLESVLKRNPNHPGANHYYIHAVEASPHPERGLASARRLATLVPGAGHLVHMPAHVYMRTGNYAGAVEANRRAAEVDAAYIRKYSVQGVYLPMYYLHNFHFLAIAAGMDGNAGAAREAAAKLIEEATPLVKEMPMAEFYMPTALYVQLRFQRWDDVFRYPEPETGLLTTHALWHYARGVAYAARRDAVEAAAEQKAFREERDKVPAEAMFNLNAGREVLEVADNVLQARLLAVRGDRDGAIGAWRRAVAVEDRLAYDEPPAWYYPVRESLGGELLRAGRPQEAEPVFRDDLSKNPGNGRSLFGLWQSLLAQKKTRAADRAGEDFEAAWKKSDVKLGIDDL